MLCSNCGKDIPFNGNVCPYCHADKSGDQMVMSMAVGGGLIGGGIGYAVNDFMGFLAGMFIGMIPLAILGLVVNEGKDAKTKGVPTLPNLKATLDQPAKAPHRVASAADPANLRSSVDGEGRYKVAGVVKVTGNDVTTYVNAASRANAKVKAELKGIAVTAVERV